MTYHIKTNSGGCLTDYQRCMERVLQAGRRLSWYRVFNPRSHKKHLIHQNMRGINLINLIK